MAAVQASPCVLGVQQAPPWQTSVAMHVLVQATVPPQPFGALPQATPTHACAGSSGVQHAFWWHTALPVQWLAQSTVPPHPSLAVPQGCDPQAAPGNIGVQHVPAWHDMPAPAWWRSVSPNRATG